MGQLQLKEGVDFRYCSTMAQFLAVLVALFAAIFVHCDIQSDVRSLKADLMQLLERDDASDDGLASGAPEPCNPDGSAENCHKCAEDECEKSDKCVWKPKGKGNKVDRRGQPDQGLTQMVDSAHCEAKPPESSPAASPSATADSADADADF